MINTGALAGRTVFVTGGSRGIGLGIALKCARDGAKIVLAAKTTEPHPKLPGTIYTAAEDVMAAGASDCLPCVVDVRDNQAIDNAVKQAVDKFGGIDVVINNASAISLTGTLQTDVKKFDLMNQVNGRATFFTTKACLPYLLKSKFQPHVLTLSPPISMRPQWLLHSAYTVAKYAMTMHTLGIAAEYSNISANCLWPRTGIATAAIEMLGGSDMMTRCRKVDIVSDSAYSILSSSVSGKCLVDETVLREAGVSDFDQYAIDPTKELMIDFFLDDEVSKIEKSSSASAEKGISSGEHDAYFESLNSKITQELKNDVNSLFNFNLTDGDAVKTYTVDLRKNPGGDKAGVTMIMPSDVFGKLVKGKVSATVAFMKGQLKIKGDMGKAMKLEKVFKAQMKK